MTIHLSDETVFKLPSVVYYNFRVLPGDLFDRGKYASLIENQCYTCALERAGKLLTNKDYTEREIERKLKSSCYPETVIARVLQALTEHHFVSDERYATEFVRKKTASVGRNRMKQDLRRKGVSDKIISEAVEQMDDEEELSGAVKLAEKLARRKDFTDRKQRAQAYAALVRRGYPTDIVKKAMEQVSKEQDDDLFEYD